MCAERFDIEAIGAGGAELARYEVSGGARVLMGWRRGAGIEVSDKAVEGRGRGYLVDRGFCCFEQLSAFLGDYVDQAVRLDACPMSGEAIDAIVGATASETLAPLLGERLR